jgi:hypothetical protein
VSLRETSSVIFDSVDNNSLQTVRSLGSNSKVGQRLRFKFEDDGELTGSGRGGVPNWHGTGVVLQS